VVAVGSWDLGRVEADAVPARGGGLRLGLVEEGDGAVLQARVVQRLPPELLDDDGGVGELPAGPVAAVHLLQLGGRAILAGALHRRRRRRLQLIRPRRLHHLHSSEIGERARGPTR